MQKSIEDNFYLMHRTIRHLKLQMTKTLRRICGDIVELAGHIAKGGRTSSIQGSKREWKIMNAVTDGVGMLVCKKDLFAVRKNIEDTSLGDQVMGDDVGVE